MYTTVYLSYHSLPLLVENIKFRRQGGLAALAYGDEFTILATYKTLGPPGTGTFEYSDVSIVGRRDSHPELPFHLLVSSSRTPKH